MSNGPWTDEENDLTVADYFAMLAEDMAGRRYNKAQHRRSLMPLLRSRERFETPNVHVDIFDRHRVILDGEECELVQVAVHREGRPEDTLGFDANSTLARRIVKPVFEAALTYEAATGVIEVVAKTREDRMDLTRFMARDLLGITIDEHQALPLREYDLSILLQPFDFPTDPVDGIASVTVKELRLMDLGERPRSDPE
jgi:hypothetical protein